LEDNGDIWIIPRPQDKKKVVYYHDDSDDFDVSEDFVKLWRSINVDAVDDINIDEYLAKNGITSMQDQGSKNAPIKRKPIKRNINRKKRQLKDNLQIAKDLEDYSEMTATAFKKGS
jgi:transcription initiation factor TFIIE subunit beta